MSLEDNIQTYFPPAFSWVRTMPVLWPVAGRASSLKRRHVEQSAKLFLKHPYSQAISLWCPRLSFPTPILHMLNGFPVH